MRRAGNDVAIARSVQRFMVSLAAVDSGCGSDLIRSDDGALSDDERAQFFTRLSSCAAISSGAGNCVLADRCRRWLWIGLSYAERDVNALNER